MSMGVMLEARRRSPFSPFRRALTTSLTPRLSWRALEARGQRGGWRVKERGGGGGG
jgi:hypothetical protein